MIERLEKIEARLKRATAGPWHAMTCISEKWAGIGDRQTWNNVAGYIPQLQDYGIDAEKQFRRFEDAEFTAHAREDIPFLIAALRSTSARAEWREDAYGYPRRALYIGNAYVGSILYQHPQAQYHPDQWRGWFMHDDEGGETGWFETDDEARRSVEMKIDAPLALLPTPTLAGAKEPTMTAPSQAGETQSEETRK
jgi:hypothetical protein